MIALLLLTACPPADRAWLGAADTGLAPPAIAWTWPQDGSTLATDSSLVLQAKLRDDDGTVTDLQLVLTVDDQPVTPQLAADGTVSVTLTVQAGEHTAQLSATDGDGLSTQAERHWSGNSAPVIEITTPLDGSTNTTGQAWTLSVQTADKDGSAADSISSSFLRVTFDGAEVSRTAPWEASMSPLSVDMLPLTGGAHTISAQTSDGLSTVAMSITVYGS